MPDQTRIPIYAPDEWQAAKLAAHLNLALRHWEYAGPSTWALAPVWADVGSAMDILQRKEWALGDLPEPPR